MAALDRALALAQMDDVPVAVGEQLDLDVTGALDEALGEDAAVAEARLSLPRCRFERLRQLLGRANNAHAPSAASGRRLDDEREAELAGLARLDHRDACLAREPLGLELVPGGAESAGGGPTKTRPAPATASAKSPFSARNP